ncbi:hypothetical protein [Streptomyces sp. NPDC094032]|uniref:hypothetical protein n=1 Tax=Streptomyces sp. NPDC094032 TaxID=3155308 RepID=UPI003321773D
MASTRRSAACRATLFLTAGALALTSALPAVAAPETVTKAGRKTTSEWDVPNDSRGGIQVYDGFTDDNVRKTGLYGMVYHLDGVDDATECGNTAKSWPKQEIDYLKKPDAKLKKFTYLRQEAEFEPTGKRMTVPPGGTVTVKNETETTESHESSTELSFGFAGEFLSAGFSGGDAYTDSHTIRKGQESSVHNPSNTLTQEYAFGFTRDYYAVQMRPWDADWHEKGSRIYVGSTVDSPARFMTVPVTGCYRKAYFATISAVRSSGAEKVAEYVNKGNAANCRMTVNSDDATWFRRVKEADGTVHFDEVQGAELEKGTCVKHNGKRDDSTGATFFQMSMLAPAKGKKCRATPAARCTEKLWVKADELTGTDVEPPAPPQWKTGQKLFIRSNVKGKTNEWLGWDAATHVTEPVRSWELVKAGKGQWRLKNGNGKCLSGTGDTVSLVTCGDDVSQAWDFRISSHTKRGVIFFLQESGWGDCVQYKGVGDAVEGPECKQIAKQHWRISES